MASAFAADGTAIVAWCLQRADGRRVVQVAIREPGGRDFGTARTVSRARRAERLPPPLHLSTAAARGGRTLVAWEYSDDRRVFVRLAAPDGRLGRTMTAHAMPGKMTTAIDAASGDFVIAMSAGARVRPWNSWLGVAYGSQSGGLARFKVLDRGGPFGIPAPVVQFVRPRRAAVLWQRSLATVKGGGGAIPVVVVVGRGRAGRPLRLEDESMATYAPAMATDGNGRLVVAWQATP